ncbi:UNVERIFIED_CONTAM: hypothetical protein FKN15_030037 [Acipenser sinensis]
MEQDCQVGKPMPAAAPSDPNVTSPDNHHDLTASAREEVGSTKENEGIKQPSHAVLVAAAANKTVAAQYQPGENTCRALHYLHTALPAAFCTLGRNTVLNICGNKPAQELRRNVFNFDKIQQSQDSPCEDPVTQTLGETTEYKKQSFKTKELVQLLHKTLEAAQLEKRTCKQFLAAAGEQERLELVRHKERCIADLDVRLEALLKDKEELEQRLAMQDCQVNELQQHVQLMMEKNNAKQEVILNLVLFDHHDDIEAHKIQNKFLNSEIYQLTKLWRNSSEEEKGLLMKCAYLEAKNCQIESKYLIMLRRLQESKGLDSSQQEMVKRLIEDALQGDQKDVFKLNPVSEYDDYGFKTIPDYEVEDVKLLAKIQALEIRSNNLRNNEMVDKPLRTRWANYLASRPLGQLAPSPELKGLIRCGIPVEYREQVWRWIVRTRTQVYRKRNPNRYQELRKHCEVSEHPASRQIRLDLHRTLTSNKHFSSPTSDAVQKLQRILLAFSWQNPTIGYCQGLNRLAAIALLVLKDEEDAFWCLVAVVEIIMPQDYYSKTLTASQADQRVFRDFLAEKMPRLTAHFKEHSIDHSLITFNWFLVVFVESLVSDILLRVWDAFLYEGTKCAYLEAKNCQIESKYLIMLRRLQESKGLDSSQQEMVKRLIEDALQGDQKDVFKLNPVSEYDDYGFKTIPDYEVEDVKLLAKIQALEIRSNNLRNNEMVDKPLRTRWANYLASRPLGQLAPSPELKGLIRCGIPVEYREQVWRWIVRTRTQVYRKRNPNRYQELRKHCEVSEHPASRQIRLDLHRTLTSNKHFSSPTSDAVQKLQRILLAFSWQNPTIGYCQGLNRLAAIALLVLKDEEDAFWCLVAVVEIIMPQDYYSKTLTASQADQRVFRDFLAEKMPRLTAHFKEHSIDHSLITFNWFLVVFVESLVSDILLRVWDAFLYEGTKVIFRYALALFKYNEEDILKIHDNLEIYQYLRFFTKTISDGRKLMDIAFNDMNPFPMKLLKNRREFHMERLTAELQELERIQEEFVKEQQVERKDKDLDTAVSEDEEVIFRYALALFKYNEEDILKIHDNLEIYQYLRFFTKTISDGRKLMDIAFNDMNPFPMKLLKNRREFHMERLTAELQELERIQEEFVKEQQVERKDKDLDTAVSEDEEVIQTAVSLHHTS